MRIVLSHHPIPYALIGGIGIVLFWKGVWETAEYFPVLFGPVSIVIGTLILLATGLLVSFFIGDNIIISGFNKEKKLVEKTESEVRAEEAIQKHQAAELHIIETELKDIEKKLGGKPS